jgi:general secretion pathway protein E
VDCHAYVRRELLSMNTERSVPARLGELLVREQRLAPRDLEQALAAQSEMGDLLGRVLIRLGLLSETDLARTLAEQLDVPLVLAADYPAEPLEVPQLRPDYLLAHAILPLRRDGDELHVAMAVPQDPFLARALHLATGLHIRPALALESELQAGLERLYVEQDDDDADGQELHGLGGDGGSDFVEHLKDLASEAPVIRGRPAYPLPGRWGVAGRRSGRRRARGRGHLAHQAARAPQHRRTAPAPGWPHQDPGQGA